MFGCVCVCVCERERGCVCVCVCVNICEKGCIGYDIVSPADGTLDENLSLSLRVTELFCKGRTHALNKQRPENNILVFVNHYMIL